MEHPIQVKDSELYLFELGSRTIAGYVKNEELINPETHLKDEIDEFRIVQVDYPSVVTLQMVPVQGKINVPNNQPQMGVATVVMPYHVSAVFICMDNVLCFQLVPKDNYLHGQMKDIISHFESGYIPQKGFSPKIVK